MCWKPRVEHMRKNKLDDTHVLKCSPCREHALPVYCNNCSVLFLSNLPKEIQRVSRNALLASKNAHARTASSLAASNREQRSQSGYHLERLCHDLIGNCLLFINKCWSMLIVRLRLPPCSIMMIISLTRRQNC